MTDCNADLGHPCDANDGEPCADCESYHREMMAWCRRNAHWQKPATYAQDMIDGGRGHLLREDER